MASQVTVYLNVTGSNRFDLTIEEVEDGIVSPCVPPLVQGNRAEVDDVYIVIVVVVINIIILYKSRTGNHALLCCDCLLLLQLSCPCCQHSGGDWK